MFSALNFKKYTPHRPWWSLSWRTTTAPAPWPWLRRGSWRVAMRPTPRGPPASKCLQFLHKAVTDSLVHVFSSYINKNELFILVIWCMFVFIQGNGKVHCFGQGSYHKFNHSYCHQVFCLGKYCHLKVTSFLSTRKMTGLSGSSSLPLEWYTDKQTAQASVHA